MKSNQPTLAIAIPLILGFLVVGCSHHDSKLAVKQSAGLQNPPVGTVPEALSQRQVMIYRVAETPTDDKTADPNGLIPIPINLPNGEKDPASFALSSMTTVKGSPLPTGTKINHITIDPANHLATVDFSKEFRTNFSGGDTREAQVVNSVLATLGQFSTIQKVQFLVDGKKIDSLGGTQELDSPLPTPQSSQQVASETKSGT